MEEQFSIPVYASELIEQLDKQFPKRSPRLNETEREIFHYVGMRDLVDFLQERLNEDELEQIDPAEDNISNVYRNP